MGFKNIFLVGRTQLFDKCVGIVESNTSIPVQSMCTDALSKPEIMESLCKVKDESLVLSIMNPYIFTRDVVGNENLTIINVHQAILPGHRGRNPYAWNIFMGDEAGITWHLVDEGIDTGKIIKTIPVELKDDDVPFSLLRRENEMVKKSLQELLPQFISGQFTFEKPKEREEYFHKNSDIPNRGELDLSWKGEQISRFLRCMDFGTLRTFGRPYFFFDGKKYVVIRYMISKNAEHKEQSIGVSENVFFISKDGFAFRLEIDIVT